MIFSTTSFSSAPYSALGETLVEVDATLENFILLTNSPSLKLLFNSQLDGNIQFLSSVNNKIYSSYDFLSNSQLDISERIKSYNLLSFDAIASSLQSAIIKFNSEISLDSLAILDPSTILKISEIANIENHSNLDLETKIKIHSDSLLLIQALFESLQVSKIKVQSLSELENIVKQFSYGNIKSYNVVDLNNNGYFFPIGTNKNFNSSILDNRVLLQGFEKLFTTGFSDFSTKSEFLSFYLSRSTGSTNLNGEIATVLDGFLKNYNIIDLNAVANLSPFASVSFANNNAILNIEAVTTSEGIIKNYGFSNFISEVEFLSSYLSRTVGGFTGNIESEFFPTPNYKTYGSFIGNGNINIQLDSKLKFYDNLSNMEVVGTIVVNLSQRNRDIVYYILAIDRSKPFELQILRSK
jgi:hypothetical protein